LRFQSRRRTLVARLNEAGHLKRKQVVVAAMRKLLVLGFGVPRTGKQFDPAFIMPAWAL
jgi:hypothetical protein